MKKTLLFIILAAALAMAACKPKSTIATVAPAATQTPAATTEPTQATITTSNPIPALCTVTTLLPTPEPTEAAVMSLFAPASDADHTLGEATAAITITEYSDFQ